MSGINSVNQRKGNKVVISQNNPFFLKSQTKISPNVSSNSGGQQTLLNKSKQNSGASAEYVPLHQPSNKTDNDYNLDSIINSKQQSIKTNQLQHSVNKTHETSVVSNDLFYSPMQQPENRPDGTKEAN